MLKKISTFLITLLFTLCISGCAKEPGQAKVDPYEKFNRAMFAFNMDLDHLIARPVAQTYNFIFPKWVQQRVTNVFDNVDELTSIPNDVLQGKFLFMMNDFWRLVINTTVGLGGMFDVAKHIGLRPHYETFGLTLAYWEDNKVESPYLVLPFLGPNTFRSGFGLIPDYPTTPYAYIPWKYWYYDFGARGLNAINFRSSLLEANKLIDTAFDPYIFVRNAYLQRRNEILKENIEETYRGNVTVSSIKMTAQDFQATAKVKGSGFSSPTTEKQAEEAGYILDDEGSTDQSKANETEKKSEPAATTTEKTKTEEKTAATS